MGVTFAAITSTLSVLGFRLSVITWLRGSENSPDPLAKERSYLASWATRRDANAS